MKNSTPLQHIRRSLMVLLAALFVSNLSLAQNCGAAFTYTVGSAGQVSFTDASVGTTTNTTYNWNWSGPSGWGTSSLNNPMFSFNYNGVYYVSLSIYDSLANCQSYAVDTVTITNAQPCQVSFTYAVGSNGQVSFTNTSIGNNSYYWNFGDGVSSQQASPAHTYAYNGNYYVDLWADTTGGQCGGYYQVLISINNAPPCNVVASYTVSNVGNGVYILNDTVTTNPSTFSFHNWYVNGSYMGCGNPFTIQFPSNGTFSVCEIVSDSANFGGAGCSDTICNNITVSGVTCNDSAFFFLVPDSSNTGSGLWYAYVYSWNNSWPVNATWTWGDGTSSSGLYPSHSYATPGWYTICVTAYFACGDSSTYCQADSLYRSSSQMVTVNVVNGANGIQSHVPASGNLNAYPNPFSEQLNINFNSHENNTIVCSLYDTMGSLVFQQQFSSSAGENHLAMNTGDLAKGIYFLHLSNSDGKGNVIKVIK